VSEPVRWALLALGVPALLAVVVVALWVSRTRTLALRVGSFSCSLGRTPDGPWARGVAQYGRVRLYWWRRMSLRPRAALVWDRSQIVVLERRVLPAGAGEGSGIVLVRCRVSREPTRSSEVTMQMSVDAFTGFRSWLEATPTRVGSVI